MLNVELHNATQIQVSSGSEISVASSMVRQRRVDLARAKRELAEARASEILAEATARAKRVLAEARVVEAQAELDFAAGFHAGSIVRLDDVRSEGGTSARARSTTDVSASPPQGGLPHPTSSSPTFTSAVSPPQGGLPAASTGPEVSPPQGGLPSPLVSPPQGGLPAPEPANDPNMTERTVLSRLHP